MSHARNDGTGCMLEHVGCVVGAIRAMVGEVVARSAISCVDAKASRSPGGYAHLPFAAAALPSQAIVNSKHIIFGSVSASARSGT